MQDNMLSFFKPKTKKKRKPNKKYRSGNKRGDNTLKKEQILSIPKLFPTMTWNELAEHLGISQEGVQYWYRRYKRAGVQLHSKGRINGSYKYQKVVTDAELVQAGEKAEKKI